MDKKKIYSFSVEIKKLINEEQISEAQNRISQEKLSENEKEFLFMCLKSGRYDPKTDSFMLCKSDNSAFLNLLSIVKNNSNNNKK